MYRALYRKWRPQVFTDVSGQGHITETLMNEVSSSRLSHAYLFTGSRGTGKTTCAKILAKAVNCLNPVDGNPCNECAICRGIDDGSVLDVTEIDAASNNSVDNIRDLRDEANFTPAMAKYRVYIIDEVHMLSTGAFNALLKTLEEPPEHVLFILATTEVQKLPATILSRCQRFDFRRIPPEDISARLMTVAESEKLELSEDAALLIARISDGALRDALSILDQCSGYNEPITVTTVGNAAGLLGRSYLFEISDAVLSGNSALVLDIIDRLHNSSCDLERLMGELVNHFRNVMLAKTAKNPEKFIVCTPDELVKIQELAGRINYGTLLYIMETLCRESSQLKYSSNQRARVETTLIRLCTPALSTDNAALVRRIDELEAQLMSLKAHGITVNESPKKAEPVNTPISEPETTKESAPAVVIQEKAVPKPSIASESSVDASEEKPEREASQNNTAAAENESTAFEDESPEDIPFPEPPDAPEEDVKPQAEPVKTTVINSTANSDSRRDFGIVTESDKSVPFTAWDNTLNQLSKINRPLYPILIGSSAYRAGNTVFIKAKNTAFPQLFTQKMNVDSITEALARATGEKLKPMVYTDGASPLANEAAEPVDALIDKLNKMKIDYIVEE